LRRRCIFKQASAPIREVSCPRGLRIEASHAPACTTGSDSHTTTERILLRSALAMGESTEKRVRAVVAKVGRLEGEFDGEADIFRDLGVKSVAALDLLLSLEEEFSIAISDEAFGDARTVSALVALVEKQT
jgi:acyl carrier protein